MHPENKLSHNWLIKKAINDCVRTRLPALSGRVLDLGCGTRPFAADILLYADEYFGIDWGNSPHELSADLIANLNKPLPMIDGFADHVVSFEVMEHLAEPRIMLAEAFRILREGGQLTLSVPFQWWVHEAPWDFYRYTEHGLRYMLEQAGFTSVSIVPTTGFWSMWILKFNYQTFRLAGGAAPIRSMLRLALIPFWWANQHLALRMDRYWPEERETAGYFVTAVKP